MTLWRCWSSLALWGLMAWGCTHPQEAHTIDGDRSGALSTVGLERGEQRPRADAKFEPPAGRVLHAMGQWRKGNDAFIAAINAPELAPAAALTLIHVGDWGARTWERRLLGVTRGIQQEVQAGRILNVTLHLAGLGPDSETIGIDEEIAADSEDGKRYEERIRDVARVVSKAGVPAYIRIGGEMSGWWEDQTPYVFPVAYRRVVDMFREEGAHNTSFVWCYMPAAPDDFDDVSAGRPKWYPGDDVVDWFSIDVFTQGDFTGPLGRGRLRTRAGRSERFLAMARHRGKPVLINEASAVDVALTPAREDGQLDWDAWYKPFFAWLDAHPEIKIVHYLNVDWTTIGNAQDRGWLNADISTNKLVLDRFVDELRDPKWMHAHEVHLLKGAEDFFTTPNLDAEIARLERLLSAGGEPRRGPARGRSATAPERARSPR